MISDWFNCQREHLMYLWEAFVSVSKSEETKRVELFKKEKKKNELRDERQARCEEARKY